MSFFHPLSDCKKFWLVGKVKLLFGVVPKTLRVSIHKEKKVFAVIYQCTRQAMILLFCCLFRLHLKHSSLYSQSW